MFAPLPRKTSLCRPSLVKSFPLLTLTLVTRDSEANVPMDYVSEGMSMLKASMEESPSAA